jgi:hypothetical protein
VRRDEQRGGLALNRRDALVAGSLLAVGVLLRLPLFGLGETVDEALDPIINALALRDHFELRHPGFFHFGYGRGVSHLPFVLGADGLLDVQTRRSLFQAIVAPLVFLAGRRLTGRPLAPALAALLLVTGEEFLHTGVSGHETYLSAEWIALAVLASTFSGRRAALLLGASLGMALMSHPFALPSLVLLALHRHWKIGAAAYVGVLMPQIIRVGAAIAGGTALDRIFLMRASRPMVGPDGAFADFLRGAGHVDVLLLLIAPILLVVRHKESPRFVGVALVGAAVTFAEVLGVGWSEGWYWRPLAPWLAVCLAVAASTQRRPLQVAFAIGTVIVCSVSVQRTGSSYQRNEEGIKYTDHVAAISQQLEAHRGDGPMALIGGAQQDGFGRRSDVWPVYVDLLVGEQADDLLAADSREATVTFVHLAGGQAALAAAQAVGGSSLVAGREVALLRVQGPVQSVVEAFCLHGPAEFSDTARLQRAVGGSHDVATLVCPGPIPGNISTPQP